MVALLLCRERKGRERTACPQGKSSASAYSARISVIVSATVSWLPPRSADQAKFVTQPKR
jgi:hypothetical protein